MDTQTVPEPVAKRADQLVVGDRIAHHRLPSTYAEGPGEVVYVKAHTYRGHASVFVAYVHEDGYYDSTAYLPDGYVEVYPAVPPIARHYDASDVDGADCACGSSFESVDTLTAHIAQPRAERPLVVEGGVWAVPVAGGLIEVDPPEGFVPASAPVEKAECGAWCGSGPGGACNKDRGHDGEHGDADERPGLIVGDTAAEQYANAYEAYERDQAMDLPRCPNCRGRHHTVEPCR